jgi:uncharacterized protein (DUF2267 family)
MSTGLTVFDSTVQESNAWLKRIEQRLQPCDRQQAYAALRAVTHALRDRLPADAVLGLSAQLPMLLRGMFFEGWRPVEGPTRIRDPEEFAQDVARRFPPGFPRQGNEAAEAVFRAMGDKLDPGEMAKLVRHLPIPLRSFFPIEHRVD